jgi:YidC/Oxa1 family membrane protein insertase
LKEIQNPNSQSGGEKNIFLVFGLTFLAIIVSQFLLERFGPKPPANQPQQQQTQQAQPQTQSPSASAATTSQPTQANSVAAPATKGGKQVAATPTVQTKQATSEQETVIESDLYRVVFTNKGAVVKSWILKKHTDAENKPLDLVNAKAAPEFGYPLAFFTHDDALTKRLNEVLYVPSATGNQKSPATITFEYADGELNVRKSISFDDTYTAKIDTQVTRNGGAVEAFPSWPAGFGDQHHAPSYAGGRISWAHEDRVEHKPAQEGFISKSWISNRNTISGPISWAGVADQYFAAIFLPDDPQNVKLVELHNTIPQDPNEQDPEKRKKNHFSILGAAVGNPSGHTTARLFVGPKNLKELNAVRAYAAGQQPGTQPAGRDLEGVVEFGTFGIIAKPLFLWLAWTHDHWISNWGWAIIFLTFCINLALFPLRYPGMKAALLQQKVAPEVAAINRRYQGIGLTYPRQRDKQQEIQAVWDREGIKPAAGCLPMVIQLPFLFAFYQMLTVANELRHAPWLWIKDLSSPDPFYIMPIAIMVSMFAMQRITPMSGMDPAQAKMMQTMMPIMIGLFSWSLPAGLGVYWFTGNIIGFATQYYMNNSKMAREVREHLAKRAEKKGKKDR